MPLANDNSTTIAAIEAAAGGAVQVAEILAIGISTKKTVTGTFKAQDGRTLGFELIPEGVAGEDRVFTLKS